MCTNGVRQTEAKINAPVINLTNYKLPRADWADHEHLNLRDCYIYSNMLAKCLKLVIFNN